MSTLGDVCERASVLKRITDGGVGAELPTGGGYGGLGAELPTVGGYGGLGAKPPAAGRFL